MDKKKDNKKMLQLVYDVPVSVNQYLAPAANIIKVKGKSIAKAYLYETEIAKDYKLKFMLYVRKEMKKQEWVHQDGKFVVVDMTVYFERTNRDANNLWKILLDSLVSCKALCDDNIVLEKTNRIYYDNKNPRIELMIYHSDNVGIFDTDTDYQLFLSKCQTCTRYENNCSILKKALESRIQEEITYDEKEIVCSRFKQKK